MHLSLAIVGINGWNRLNGAARQCPACTVPPRSVFECGEIELSKARGVGEDVDLDNRLVILGVWKFPCAIVLLGPGIPRLKEWAYAGSLFNYSGAVAYHALTGDGPGGWAAPLVFAVLTLVSWALRPPERRLASTRPGIDTPPAAWIVPIGLAVVMLVLALFTLPTVPPSF